MKEVPSLVCLDHWCQVFTLDLYVKMLQNEGGLEALKGQSKDLGARCV